MSGLAVRNKSGELLQYTGTQFEGLENTGTHHLCVRTGAGVGGVKKYGLTSAPLNDKYKALKMRIPDNAGGNGGREAYIAQRYSTSASASSARTYTASRVSNYVSSTTLRTASSSKLSTGTATRIDTRHTVYYGTYPLTKTENAMFNQPSPTTYTSSEELTGSFILASSATTFYISSNVRCTYSHAYRRKTTQYAVYEITASKTSSVSTYVTSKTLSTASSSKLSTGNATRSSAYNTSSSVSTTSSKLTHNANL